MPKDTAELQQSENNKELGKTLMRETGKIKVVRKTDEKE